MALLPILHYPDPRLRQVSKPVEVFDDALLELVSDMGETMYEAPGVGLAAPQIGQFIRLLVYDPCATDEEQRSRARDIHRRVGADEDADDQRDRERRDDLSTEEEQRDEHEQRRQPRDDRP